jgi:hypothetical protein
VWAAALAAVQNILRYGTRAEKHRRASRDYGNVMRWIGEVLGSAVPAHGLEPTIEEIRRRLEAVDYEAPNVPADIWVWAVAAVEAEVNKEVLDASTFERYHWPQSWWRARRRRQ